MALCPICADASAGKRIAFKGFEVFDLCIKCASYSVCLISPNVEVKVKENAIRWAEMAIENNREKIYLANCIRSWKQSAEDFVALNAPAPIQTFKEEPKEVMDIDSTEINLDATIKGFNTGNYSAVMYQENKHTIDSSVLDVKKEKFFAEPSPTQESAPFFKPAVSFSAPAVEEESVVPFSAPAVEEEPVEEKEEPVIKQEAPSVAEEEREVAEAAENSELSVADYLKEICETLRSINAKMERIEKDIEELKNR